MDALCLKIADGQANLARLGETRQTEALLDGPSSVGGPLQRKELCTPYIHIRIPDEGVTPEQKAELVARSTPILVDVLGEDPDTTMVVIEEVPTENEGIRGES